MTALILAGLSAAAYGLSDFVGGLRSRSAHFIWVTLAAQVVAAVGTLVWAGFRPGVLTPEALAWGALAAVGNIFGSMMLLRGLASGAMHVAGPLSAVGAAVIPVLVGVATGDRPAALSWVGVVTALPGIWLVASGSGPEADVAAGPGVPSVSGAGSGTAGASEGTRDGVLAGVGFGVFFVSLGRADAASGAWPLVSMALVALVLASLVALWVRPPGHPWDGRGGWLMGACGLAGSILYYLAVHEGMLSLVAVVTSLYPAFTVALAVLVLHERPSRLQVGGLLLATASVVLIALGGH